MPFASDSAKMSPTMPTIVHNRPRQIITIYVLVFLRTDGTDIEIEAAPVVIPQSVWGVEWKLTVDPGIHAEFTNPGILINPKDLPPKVTVGGEVDEKDRCIRQITNDALSSNEFNYGISVEWSRGENTETMIRTVHDPAIAVTQDPITRSQAKPAG